MLVTVWKMNFKVSWQGDWLRHWGNSLRNNETDFKAEAEGWEGRNKFKRHLYLGGKKYWISNQLNGVEMKEDSEDNFSI